MPQAGVHPQFPGAPQRAGMYESFYLRAVAPDEPLGVWIRCTVHKPPGLPPRGSVWFTLFDPHREGPLMQRTTNEELSVPPSGWIAVGDSQLGPTRAEGVCGEARWSLSISGTEESPLHHLPSALLYRSPLPRTKLTSPMPTARFDGVLELSGPDPRAIELRGWRGMVGHNWGSEHAERWIWLHGIGFNEDPAAWLDVAIGRVRVAGRTTPWVANGALYLDGEHHRLGGLGEALRPKAVGGLLVAETPQRCTLSLPGAGGLLAEAHVQSDPRAIARWRYADPDSGASELGQPDVSNCSIAALTLTVRRPGLPARTLRTPHGAAYELGSREREHR
jgi:hypothetical protein